MTTQNELAAVVFALTVFFAGTAAAGVPAFLAIKRGSSAAKTGSICLEEARSRHRLPART
ncbi:MULTISPECIES: hypothetical protein [unclassified Bradyrhizobium]